MASPFPGMDPYLENPAIWSGVHAAIIGRIFERLGPMLRPRYAVRYEERVYLTDAEDPAYRLITPDVRIDDRDQLADFTHPWESSSLAAAIAEPIAVAELEDEEVHERSLKVIDLNDRSIVTVIELLSPTNKKAGSYGRKSFLQKRKEVFASPAHWLEIDLLRRGKPTTRPSGVPKTAYRAYLSRAAISAGEFRKNFVWPMPLRRRLPIIGVPLRGGDPDVPLDLQAELDVVIECGSYDLDFDYSRPPVPPLSPTDATWARTLSPDDADSHGEAAV